MKPKKSTLDKILVAIDGSEYSPKALDYACKIAKIDNAQLQIINVIEEHVNIGHTFSRQLEKIAKELLHRYEELAKSSGVINLATIQVRGNAAEQILETADRENVNTIVVGSRGHYRSKVDFILGSISYKLAHYSKCTVVIVK